MRQNRRQAGSRGNPLPRSRKKGCRNRIRRTPSLPRPLLLPGGAEKAVYNSVQCLWAADGLHAFLRVLPWTAETAEWDADARAEEFLIAENENRAEDARGVYLLDGMKEEPEWERILEDSLPDFPGMLPAEDGSRLLFVTTGAGSAGDME